MWEHFHHQADIGVRGVGETVEQAFEEGAVALMEVMCKHDKVAGSEQVEVECEAEEVELLFADWLNSIIYEMDTRGMLFSKFEVSLNGMQLLGKMWGEKINTEKHETAVEVKAATYMMLKVEKNDSGKWVAECVVDV
jgi:tRNA nucleotidyltransferase (CCA-adding enzyme)